MDMILWYIKYENKLFFFCVVICIVVIIFVTQNFMTSDDPVCDRETVFLMQYHGLFADVAYRDQKDGIWKFKRNGKICRLRTSAAMKVYKNIFKE